MGDSVLLMRFLPDTRRSNGYQKIKSHKRNNPTSKKIPRTQQTHINQNKTNSLSFNPFNSFSLIWLSLSLVSIHFFLTLSFLTSLVIGPPCRRSRDQSFSDLLAEGFYELDLVAEEWWAVRLSRGGSKAWWLWVWVMVGLRHGGCGCGSWWVCGAWGVVVQRWRGVMGCGFCLVVVVRVCFLLVVAWFS
ncbi:hypothetical protein ACB092_05G137000 [Castanea dentata]